MASTTISAPVRGVTHQLSRLSIRQQAGSTRCNKCLSTPFARSITTSTSSKASVTPITTSAGDYVPVVPFEDQTVLATIHQFPSLEPLRFQTYPANHLYLPTRRDILHRAVIYEGDMTRLGTASTKSRHEVHGSRRKIRPQKGSGRARLGDKKSPMLRGGGVAFGPRPRDFATELPAKVYDLAWRTALSYRFRKGELVIVDNAMEIESPSPQLLGDIFKHHEKLRGRGRSLLVTLDERPLLEEALIRMDRGGQALTWEEVDVKNLLELSRVIIERDALRNILLSHQQDITHTRLTPWHKSLIKSNPPSDLESIIGWAEFRDLQVFDRDAAFETQEAIREGRDPKSKDTERQEKTTARASAYESVASKRYELASTLPKSSPQHTDLTISVYNLTAESKALHFQVKTGMPWSEYALPEKRLRGVRNDQEFNYLVKYREKTSNNFPSLQGIDYQIVLKTNLATDAAQTSRTEAEELEVDIAELELQRYNIQLEAALLAAQTDEHYAEAQRLAGDEAMSELSILLAGHERSAMESLERQVLEQEVKMAEMKVRVLLAKKRYGKELDAASRAAEDWRERLDAARAADEVEEDDVDEEGGVVLEATGGEEAKREEKK
ncbi:ribosomal protein L4 [Ophiobolus disseminans]|uniref:Large ribosomal subunit protein uL4m n=1 Tax=Ophiobolus disseminans TaxID=1469910 RepID=A0A6A6ZNJ3_9PLEO|nr:ribosomal protein L4 [Ophiobolus disseminans]